jgi:hypothetical protein
MGACFKYFSRINIFSNGYTQIKGSSGLADTLDVTTLALAVVGIGTKSSFAIEEEKWPPARYLSN